MRNGSRRFAWLGLASGIVSLILAPAPLRADDELLRSTTIMVRGEPDSSPVAGMVTDVTVGEGELGALSSELGAYPDWQEKPVAIVVPADFPDQEIPDYSRSMLEGIGRTEADTNVMIMRFDVDGYQAGLRYENEAIAKAADAMPDVPNAQVIASMMQEGNDQLAKEARSWRESFRTWRRELAADPLRQTRYAGFFVAAGRTGLAGWLILWRMSQFEGISPLATVNFSSVSSIIFTAALMTVYTVFPSEVANFKKYHQLPLIKNTRLGRAYARSHFLKMTAISFAMGAGTQIVYNVLARFRYPTQLTPWYEPSKLAALGVKEGIAAFLTTAADTGLIDMRDDKSIGPWTFAALNWFFGVTGQVRQVANSLKMHQLEYLIFAVDAGSKLAIKAWSKRALRRNLKSILITGRVDEKSVAEREALREALLADLAGEPSAPSDIEARLKRLTFDEAIEQAFAKIRGVAERTIAGTLRRVRDFCGVTFWSERPN